MTKCSCPCHEENAIQCSMCILEHICKQADQNEVYNYFVDNIMGSCSLFIYGIICKCICLGLFQDNGNSIYNKPKSVHDVT